MTLTNCHQPSDPSASSAHFIACAYDSGDSVKAFAEEVKSVLKGETQSLSCKNNGGKCDLYINGGNAIGDLTLAFCGGVTRIEINDQCPSRLYVKMNNNLFDFGIKTNATGCQNFDF